MKVNHHTIDWNLPSERNRTRRPGLAGAGRRPHAGANRVLLRGLGEAREFNVDPMSTLAKLLGKWFATVIWNLGSAPKNAVWVAQLRGHTRRDVPEQRQ